MKSLLTVISVFLYLLPSYLNGQDFPVAWEELTSSDFALAVEKSQGVCVIPMGVIEKHGPQLPLGTDVYTAREISPPCRRNGILHSVSLLFYGSDFRG